MIDNKDKGKDQEKKKDEALQKKVEKVETTKNQPSKVIQNEKKKDEKVETTKNLRSKVIQNEKNSADKARDSGEDNNYETAANRSMLNGLTDDIIEDLKKKSSTRIWIMLGMTVYFLLITILVFVIVVSPKYSDYLKSILLGGFFANLVGLIAIIFKYIFSQSKELYDFWIGIRDGIYHKDHKE